jgi:hypothetical protein
VAVETGFGDQDPDRGAGLGFSGVHRVVSFGRGGSGSL